MLSLLTRYRTRRRRRDSSEEDLFKAIYGVLVLVLIYLFLLYYTNRPEFYRWIGYAVGGFILLSTLLAGWIGLTGSLKERHFNKLVAAIRTNGLQDELQNFINRFGRGQERSKNPWEYRGYKIDWNRINELIADFARRGVRMSRKDFNAVLRYYIDEKEAQFTVKNIQSEFYSFSSLNGSTFEHLLQRLYEKMGYVVQLTGRTGDQGGDLVAIKGQERLLIQAKCYKSYAVGNDAVQQAVAAMKFYDCNKAIVVTTSEFTAAATELARANQVNLISRRPLQEMLLQYLSENWK